MITCRNCSTTVAKPLFQAPAVFCEARGLPILQKPVNTKCHVYLSPVFPFVVTLPETLKMTATKVYKNLNVFNDSQFLLRGNILWQNVEAGIKFCKFMYFNKMAFVLSIKVLSHAKSIFNC